MTPLRVRQLVFGALFFAAGIFISRLQGPVAPLRGFLAFLLCGLGGLGVLNGLGIIPHKP
jgi:hypothetical protein